MNVNTNEAAPLLLRNCSIFLLLLLLLVEVQAFTTISPFSPSSPFSSILHPVKLKLSQAKRMSHHRSSSSTAFFSTPPDSEPSPEITNTPSPPSSSSSSYLSPLSSASPSSSSPLMQEAMKLKKQAEKARLEAQQMDAQYILSKIKTLETQLSSLQKEGENDTITTSTSTSSMLEKQQRQEEQKNIMQQIQLLKYRLDPTSNPSPTTPNSKKKETIKEEESSSSSSPYFFYDQERRKQWSTDTPTSTPTTTTSTITTSNDTLSTIDNENDNDDVVSNTTISPQKMADAISGFEKLPTIIQDMIAQNVGLDNGKNSTMVVETLVKEGKMKIVSGDDDEFNDDRDYETIYDNKNKNENQELRTIFELDSTSYDNGNLIDLYIDDLENADRDRYIETILPDRTRKYLNTISDGDMDLLYEKVFGLKTFNPTAKPEYIPGGYIIRGENRLTKPLSNNQDDNNNNNKNNSNNNFNVNDELIRVLDERILEEAPDIANNIQCCYIMDPTPFEEPELDMGQDLEEPVLVVFEKDMTPKPNAAILTASSIVSLGAIFLFSIGTFVSNNGVTTQVQESKLLGSGDITWLDNYASPLILSVLGIQLIHELGHRIIALRDKMDIGLPTIVPSLQTGLTGCITPIKSPPKNFSSLFDFAMVGPLFGMTASVASLIIGLQKTVEMYSYSSGSANIDLSTLPALPIDFLKLSSLAGGIVEIVLGSGTLLSPDPANTVISLHPLAIAGYVGVLVNALNLLPLGSKFENRLIVFYIENRNDGYS